MMVIWHFAVALSAPRSFFLVLISGMNADEILAKLKLA